MDSYHHHLPKLGQTRCYWALLSTDLQFIYLDPVLAYHLETEADLLVGKSLLSFVHPDEKASAKTDLRSVLESRTLHGSVTRVRFSRLSKIRRQLGYTGPPQTWSEEDKLAVDANYMAVDIVINWAAEGLVLCFIHATVDLDPQSDNDEVNKSHWTNWCGTPYMPPEQIQLLFQRLLMCVPQQSPNNTRTRIFQILANQPRRQLLLSWPPDQGNGFTGRDFAKLVENAEMAADPQKGNDAKTSCTRRYRATQLMSPSLGEVESIFIPHGAVIFACHKVESSSRNTSANPTPMEHQLTYNVNNSPNYPPSSAPPYYDSPTSYPLNPTYNQGYLAHQSISIPRSPPTYPSSRWSQAQQSQNYSPTQPLHTQQQWTPSPTHPIAPLPPLPPHTHTSQSMSTNNHRPGPYSNTLATGPSWQAPPGGYEVYRAPSPAGYGIYSSNVSRNTGAGNVGAGILPTGTSLTSANVTQDVVPPPKRRISPGSVKGGDQYSPATSSGRGTGNRPSGILECSSCGATASPEWRKGPSGKKELCNACGLRYARSRAKKDGAGAGGHGQGRKKRVEKLDVHEKAGPHHIVGGNGNTNGADLKRDIKTKHRGNPGGRMTPPLATIAAAAGSPGYAGTFMRRSFGSGSEYGAPGTPPSASGSESGQHKHVHYTAFAAGATGEVETQNGNTMTPSPSPPAPASIPVPSTSASGSLGISTSGASASSAFSAGGTPTLTSTSTLPQIESTQDNNFIHYHPPHLPSQQHDRAIPPLSVHPHSYSHSQLHSPQGSHSHSPHFLPAGPVSSTGHYVHTYTTRPSPLSQANNIVTGPAAEPLTPLSVSHSANEGSDGTGLSNGTQLPPLAYMDRLVGSNSSSGPNHATNGPSSGELGGGKVEFGDRSVHGGGGNTELGGGGTSVGREPLTPLSAESPIGPGVGGRHGRRLVLGGK